MRAIRTAARLSRDERGFTLTEVLVTMLMMITVMFALYSIFDMGLRIFNLSNDKIEAVENARLSMERMEREIRAAYPQNDGTLLSTHETDTISFVNRTSTNSSEAEQITYASDGTTTLERNGSAVAEGVTTLSFTDQNGTPLGNISNEEDIDMVRVELVVKVDDSEQRLSTGVALRNRSG